MRAEEDPDGDALSHSVCSLRPTWKLPEGIPLFNGAKSSKGVVGGRNFSTHVARRAHKTKVTRLPGKQRQNTAKSSSW